MTAAHPTTAFAIWCYEQGFTIIQIKHIFRREYGITGRRVTDAISKSLAPRQRQANQSSFDYKRHELMVAQIKELDGLITYCDEHGIDYWSIKQLIKESPVWSSNEPNIIWRRFQRIQRKEQRQGLRDWLDRDLTIHAALEGIFVP